MGPPTFAVFSPTRRGSSLPSALRLCPSYLKLLLRPLRLFESNRHNRYECFMICPEKARLSWPPPLALVIGSLPIEVVGLFFQITLKIMAPLLHGRFISLSIFLQGAPPQISLRKSLCLVAEPPVSAAPIDLTSLVTLMPCENSQFRPLSPPPPVFKNFSMESPPTLRRVRRLLSVAPSSMYGSKFPLFRIGCVAFAQYRFPFVLTGRCRGPPPCIYYPVLLVNAALFDLSCGSSHGVNPSPFFPLRLS